MTVLTKTLELKLVDLNVYKRQKLRQTLDLYQQALQAAFAAGCNTQSATNHVIVEYDLSGYVKNNLKKYDNSVGTATTPTSFTTTTRCGSPKRDCNLTISPRTRSSGTPESRTTRITTSGCRHAPIPNSGVARSGVRRRR